MSDQAKPSSTMLHGRYAFDIDALCLMFERMTGRAVTDLERERCLAILNAHAQGRQAAEFLWLTIS
jgi:hypothetical protein